MDVTEKIRGDLKATTPVPDGTVIRFVSYSTVMGQTYTYAAVFAAGRWWLSGVSQFFGERKFTHSDFMRLLTTHPSIREVEVATDWDGLIP